MIRYLLLVLLGFSFVAVEGCGFHLRGSAALPDSLKTMYIQGVNIQRGIGRDLKKALERNGTVVLETYQENSAILSVLDYVSERRVLSVDSNAKVNEYRLYGMLRFSVTDSDGKTLLGSREVEAVRDLRFDQNQVLGKSEEETEVRKQIDQQLVQSVLRMLTTIN